MFSIWFSQNSISEITDFAVLGGLSTFETYSLKSALAVIIAITAAEIFSTGYWQRTFSAENEATIKKASIYSGLGVFITILLLGIAGAVGAGKGLEIPTLSFIDQLSLNSLTVLALISLATLLVTSSVDTLENAISSTISIDLIKKGSKDIILGVGASATNDVGTGLLSALGFNFLDNKNNSIPYGGMGLNSLSKIDPIKIFFID